MGFLAHEFERAGLALPEESAICSSLLARKVLPESANHRLQTLIAHLGLAQGMAHRATDDAEACLGVALRCMERMGRQRSIADIFAEQGGALEWPRFSMLALRENPIVAELIAAAERRGAVEAVYLSGSTPGASRLLYPEGVVRSLDGDYLVAYSAKGQRSKRYLLERIASARAL
jgi:DNA polymerase-3 subunit epsilon